LRGGVHGAEVFEFEAVEEIFLDVANAIFHPAFFVPLAGVARSDGKPEVLGEIEITKPARNRRGVGARPTLNYRS
jgi:hypothetical protein